MSDRCPALPSGRPAVLALAVLLGGCNAADRISNIGRAPELSVIENPQTQPDYRPVALPMPAPEVAARSPNSLWRSGARAFFRDQRAGRVGDILTVVINVDDQATLSNSSARSRQSGESLGLPNFLGLESNLPNVLPDEVDPENLVNLQADSNAVGQGSINRNEEIQFEIAALITQVLPNGNLVLLGRQETRVNFEKRVLEIAGVIRPEDISSENTVNFQQIAEARVSYGGQGTISDFQQPRYGQQLFDILAPF